MSRVCAVGECQRKTDSSGISKYGKRYYRTLCDAHRRPGRTSLHYKLKHTGICKTCLRKGKTHFHRLLGFHSPYTIANVVEVCTRCHSRIHGKIIT